MNIRGLRNLFIASIIGGGFALAALLCLGVALVRSTKPLSESTEAAGVAATRSAIPMTAGVSATTITATLLPPTNTPIATDTPLPTGTPVLSPTLTDTPAPTGIVPPTYVPFPPPPTGTLPVTDTPTPSPTPTDTPTPTPTPLLLVVRGASAYGTDDGHLHIFGEVVNSTGGSISRVKIVGTFYDAADQVIDTGDTYAKLDIVGAGEATPFDLDLVDPPSTIDTYDLQVQYAFTDSVPIRLVVLSVTGSTAQDGSYHILGEVQNQHDYTVTSVTIVATFYNAEDEVIGAIVLKTALGTLVAGQKTSFEVELPEPPEGVEDYALVVEAVKQ